MCYFDTYCVYTLSIQVESFTFHETGHSQTARIPKIQYCINVPSGYVCKVCMNVSTFCAQNWVSLDQDVSLDHVQALQSRNSKTKQNSSEI